MSPVAPPVQRAMAVASAAVIAVGIVLFSWQTFTVLAFYWLENVVIGGFTLLRIFAAGARTERHAESLGSGVFFTAHYGLFCLVHGIFVATLFGNFSSAHGLFDPVLLMIGRIGGDWIGLLVIVSMVVAAAFDAMRAWSSMNPDDENVIKTIMFEPYGRIIVLHLVLIGGGFLMQLLQAPALAALLLVAFKLAYDLTLLGRSVPSVLTRRAAKRSRSA